MNKEATGQSTTKSPIESEGAPTKTSMQRYLQYLKSDTKPVSEEELYSLKVQLSAWHNNHSS